MYIWWREILELIFLVIVILSTLTKDVMECFSDVFCETVTIQYFLMAFSHEFHFDHDQRL